MIYCELEHSEIQSESTEEWELTTMLNPSSTLPPCTALHFRAQHRLFLEAHAETKYCLLPQQRGTLTMVHTQICACNNAQQKRGKRTDIKPCKENINLNKKKQGWSYRQSWRTQRWIQAFPTNVERSCEEVTTGPCVGVAVRIRGTKGRVIWG